MVRGLSCSPIQSVTYTGLSTCVWGLWYPVVCLFDLYFTTSVDQWDTPRRPLGFCCKKITVSTRQYCAFSAGAVNRLDATTPCSMQGICKWQHTQVLDTRKQVSTITRKTVYIQPLNLPLRGHIMNVLGT